MSNTTGTITIHPPSRPGLTCTVEYPNGTTKEWRESTVAARGFEVPSAERRSFALNDELVQIFGSDLVDGDRVDLDGSLVEVTDVNRSGRDVSFRINGYRRKASAYRLITVAAS